MKDLEMDYPLNIREIEALAATALKQCEEYVDSRKRRSVQRYMLNLRGGRSVTCAVPYVVFCGHGRCGKDTALAYLRSRFSETVGDARSVSSVVAPLIASALDRDIVEVLAQRHEQRHFWYHFCNALREHDPALLATLVTADCNAYAGIRAAIELEAARSAGRANLVVWIEREVTLDPTMEYGKDDCDIVIENNDSFVDFYRKLGNLSKLLFY